MIELKISKKDCGGRLDKFLFKYLKEAPSSFLYKMLRKKNIVLNGKKASGSELLKEEDRIKLFLSDETILKFGGFIYESIPADREVDLASALLETEADHSFYELVKDLKWTFEEPKILYEDSDILILSKPTNVLSQIAKKGDISLNEWISHYLIEKGELTKEDLYTMKPAVANRLDRNTSGIILAGKTLAGLRFLSELIKNRTLKKYYLTAVKGIFKEPCLKEAYLMKNENHNTVKIYENVTEGASFIKTSFIPLSNSETHSLLQVELITGKSHQIRAHLHFLGFPVIGDGKYGLKSDNTMYRRLGLTHQFLHSFMLIFPKIEGDFSYLSERTFIAPLSKNYLYLLKELELEEGYLRVIEK